MALADVCGLDLSKSNFLASPTWNSSPNLLNEANFASENFTIPYNFDVSVSNLKNWI